MRSFVSQGNSESEATGGIHSCIFRIPDFITFCTAWKEQKAKKKVSIDKAKSLTLFMSYD
jgi:hypothetical protein